uniref:Maturation protein n=1 Tax=Hubei levi-like virus 2 TaxID=1922914 RepID=A0A1L3KIR4_9VIRU|nr:hypothetical protein [Hubei levi-like virus 2]
MPAKADNKDVTFTDPLNPRRRVDFFMKRSFRNKPEWPARAIESPLQLNHCNTEQQGFVYALNGSRGGEDAPNSAPYYRATTTGWSAQLYASAYSKFADAAREGGAEWGMNILTARESVKTLIQLASTSASVIAGIVKTHRAGVNWLRKNPTASERAVKILTKRRGRDLVRARTARDRKRISREIWTLDQVTSTLLAYRYGVAPLMSDIFKTAEILSKPFEDKPALVKRASVAWNGDSTIPTVSNIRWTGKESVTLKATVSVSNPNLLLANRLGLINPAVIIWDKIPWSFVIDWWLPVGSFFSNFTAMAGLNLTGASVTRERNWSSYYRVLAWPYVLVGNGTGFGKVKVRTVGSLPIPSSVPFGTGLGIQRGQNAIALITQKLLRR